MIAACEFARKMSRDTAVPAELPELANLGAPLHLIPQTIYQLARADNDASATQPTLSAGAAAGLLPGG